MTKTTIMLVDDEELVLTSLRRSLRREGYDLIAFTDGEQALAHLEHEPVDIVISDHRMPNLTGIDFLIRVRKQHPEIVRILLTGYADMDVAIRAVNEGKLFRFLTKPWKEEDLKSALSSAVQFRGLTSRNRDLIKHIKQEEHNLQALELANPGISAVRRDETGAVIIDET